jgi:ATPase subunit of ABC transporter with duplicated ATPase domains
MTGCRNPLSGKLVIEAEDVSKAFGDRTVVADLSTRILRGDRLGIVGPNGAGKTTLLNISPARFRRTTDACGSARTCKWSCSTSAARASNPIAPSPRR